MSEEFMVYQWKGQSCTEAEFVAKMREHGMEVIHTQPIPIFNEIGGVSGYMSEAYRIVGDCLEKKT